MNSVIDSIRRDVRQLLSHPTYKQWATTQSPHDGDIYLVNNSFVYRDVSTTKSEQYIAIRFGNNGKPEPIPYIATGIRINSDLKHILPFRLNFLDYFKFGPFYWRIQRLIERRMLITPVTGDQISNSASDQPQKV